MPQQAFTVDEALISIYPVDSQGNADTANPILQGGVAESLSIHEGLEVVQDRPTGAPYPIHHHGAEEHSFEFERVWSPNVSG